MRNGWNDTRGVHFCYQMGNWIITKIKSMENQSPPMEESRKFEGVEGVWSSVIM